MFARTRASVEYLLVRYPQKREELLFRSAHGEKIRANIALLTRRIFLSRQVRFVFRRRETRVTEPPNGGRISSHRYTRANRFREFRRAKLLPGNGSQRNRSMRGACVRCPRASATGILFIYVTIYMYRCARDLILRPQRRVQVGGGLCSPPPTYVRNNERVVVTLIGT